MTDGKQSVVDALEKLAAWTAATAAAAVITVVTLFLIGAVAGFFWRILSEGGAFGYHLLGG